MSGAAEMSVGTPPLNGYGMPYRVAEEPDEITLFCEFLTQHVRRNPARNVQCRLLWSEWVRFCLKQTKKFPPPGSGEQV